MTRRMLLLSSLASVLRADSAQQVRDLFGSMTDALAACNPQIFLAAFDKTMPGYAQLVVDVTALVNEFAIESTVDFNKDDGDDRKRELEADWLMNLRPHLTGGCQDPQPAMATVSREKVLKCTVQKQGRKWKVTALEPEDFFAPPAP